MGIGSYAGAWLMIQGLLVMATAAEQTALASAVNTYDLDQFWIVHDVEGSAFLIVHVMAGSAFQAIFAAQQESIDGHVVARHKGAANRGQHRRRVGVI